MKLTPFIAAAVFSCTASLAFADPVLVVNSANTADISDEAAAKIFLRQVKTFPDGSPATPVNQKESPVTEAFRTQVLKKNASQLKAYWAQQVFTGGGKPPSELDGDDAVLKYVAETPGGVGYVESGKTRSGVRVIKR
ncbi:MAG: phosphate ABC transporter substrate-binding protein [Rubrivivax sp.]|nr:MAG: phosphate ABC transporter substrate-binding protein [Rubrivivax sp.]